MRLTVVIPAFNEEDNISRLLDALEAEDTAGSLISEVIVEASGSTDATADIVRLKASAWPKLRLISSPKRKGLAQSLSDTLREVRTDLVARVDSDVVLGQGLLTNLIRLFDDSTVGIVGPRIVPLRRSRSLLSRMVDAEYAIQDRVSRRVPKITNVQLFRRFPSVLPIDVFVDDIMIQDMATATGLRALYAPDAVVSMITPRSVIALIKQRVRTILSERIYIARHGRLEIPTGRLSSVVPSILGALRDNEVSLTGLATFVTLEFVLRIYCGLRHLAARGLVLSTWAPVR